MFSYGPLRMAMQVLDDQQELIYNNPVWTQDVVLKTFWKQWKIKTNGEKESGKSILGAQHDDDDDDIYKYPGSKWLMIL